MPMWLWSQNWEVVALTKYSETSFVLWGSDKALKQKFLCFDCQKIQSLYLSVNEVEPVQQFSPVCRSRNSIGFCSWLCK